MRRVSIASSFGQFLGRAVICSFMLLILETLFVVVGAQILWASSNGGSGWGVNGVDFGLNGFSTSIILPLTAAGGLLCAVLLPRLPLLAWLAGSALCNGLLWLAFREAHQGGSRVLLLALLVGVAATALRRLLAIEVCSRKRGQIRPTRFGRDQRLNAWLRVFGSRLVLLASACAVAGYVYGAFALGLYDDHALELNLYGAWCGFTIGGTFGLVGGAAAGLLAGCTRWRGTWVLGGLLCGVAAALHPMFRDAVRETILYQILPLVVAALTGIVLEFVDAPYEVRLVVCFKLDLREMLRSRRALRRTAVR